MSFTKVETPGLKTYKKVSIKPYFDPNQENMGLESYGLALHEGVYHSEQLACLEQNGIKRYITGLNEFAPEVRLIQDPEEKAAKITEIRKIVIELEKALAGNPIDIDDEKFWDKVKLLKPDNYEFWDRIELRAGNDITFMDPVKDPYDLIKLCAIDAGGFSIVAKSYEAAQGMAQPPKFFLDRFEETVSTKNKVKKIKNKALSQLQTMYDKDSNKLLYVTKIISPGSAQYVKSTSNDTLYELMDSYIEGQSFERDKMVAAQTFLDTARQTVGELKIRAMIKDAAFFKIIGTKSDGFIYHLDTTTMLGKNPSDVLEYLQNPLNEEVLVNIQNVIEDKWNK